MPDADNNQENSNQIVQYDLISEHAMDDAWDKSKAEIENPENFKSFLKKIKEGLLAAASAMKAALQQIANSSKQMKGTGIQVSQQRISEVALGTGELTPGNAINAAAPAKERAKFDPGVNVRGGR
jgi:hypothetical protein